MDEKKSFNILLIAVLKNPDVVQQKVTCIYSEPVPEKSKEPKYYLDLIEKWFPNKKIHIL
ncbi:hypothetical protein [Clostridium sp.]|uniref:hypothetical protein n=1 Tax=Clostridium sp. TaxID=1506 RepID=UPI002841AA11|nr:hypothetical protein [Clostridium sp.]MDR3593846.1 hypothetical protein [Clostridium sp.]